MPIHRNWLDPRRAAIYASPWYREAWSRFVAVPRTPEELTAERDRLCAALLARRAALRR